MCGPLEFLVSARPRSAARAPQPRPSRPAMQAASLGCGPRPRPARVAARPRRIAAARRGAALVAALGVVAAVSGCGLDAAGSGAGGGGARPASSISGFGSTSQPEQVQPSQVPLLESSAAPGAAPGVAAPGDVSSGSGADAGAGTGAGAGDQWAPTPELVAAARAALPVLPIKGRAPKTGYTRAQFGQAWSDDVAVPGGHNGCDTRNDILARDLQAHEVKPGTRECVVLSGTLVDPYSGETVEFARGRDTSAQVQIDHVVALSDAWQKGAQQLSEERRRDLANDPLNLQATVGRLNQQKGDGDAATWQPPNKAYRCTYAARQIVVKQVYELWVTQAEHDAFARELGRCA